MTITDQPSLWAGGSVVKKERLSPEVRWQRFLDANPWFMPRLVQLAYRMNEETGRVSTKALWEILRPEVIGSGSRFKLDNTFTSLAADRLCANYPDLAKSIVRRKRGTK